METQPTPEDIDLIQVEQINAVVDWIRQAGLDALNECEKDCVLNLTARQCLVISAVQHALAQDGRGITLSRLARALRMSVSAASHLVDTMVENGLLARSVHEDDRRSVRITLTESGMSCAAVSRAAMLEAIRELSAVLTPEENAQRVLIIDKLYRRAYPELG